MSKLQRVFLACVCAAILLGREAFAWGHAPAAWFFDVGQGDGALVRLSSKETILIDGGPDALMLSQLGRALPFFERRIDVMILSHPNLDHLWSLPEIVRRYDVGVVAMPLTEFDLPRYHFFLSEILARDIPVIDASAGRKLTLRGGTLSFVSPREGATSDVNERSAIVLLETNGRRVLFTGDAGELSEEDVLRSGADVRADVLKVGHHGSKTSSGTGFLLAVRPTISVISAGRDNRYGHPHPRILARLKRFGGRIRRTDEEGTVVIELK